MEVVFRQHLTRTEQRGPFQHIAEFSDVSGPGVRLQRLHCVRTELQICFANIGFYAIEKVLDNNWNVFPALAKRRGCQSNGTYAKVKILPKKASPDQGWHVCMTGGDQANIHSSITHVAQSAKLFFL